MSFYCILFSMKSKLETLHQGIKLGKLRLLDDGPYVWRGRTSWVCDCGRVSSKVTGNVLRMGTLTCGRCLEISSEEMAIRKFGKLKIKVPQVLTSGSAKKVMWVCDCGNEVMVSVCGVMGGMKSCGHCSSIHIDQVFGRKFGKLCLVDSNGMSYIAPKSHKKLGWVCDCGRTTYVQARYVLQGVISTCGKCNELSVESLTGKKFGRLQMRNPCIVHANSNKKVWWVCDCGGEIFSKVFAVTRGNTKSCGRCYLSYRQKWELGKDEIRSLRTPISPEQVPDWCPQLLESIVKTSKPFRARCRLCGGEYFPRWSGIRLGKSLTCGCSVSQVSSGQNEVFNFIESLGVDAVIEHKVGNLIYDIYVPSKKLLIEFNGLKWHSRDDSKKRDLDKHKNAVINRHNYVMIFEDEWVFNNSKVKNLLQNKLGVIKPVSIRPLHCDIKIIDRISADKFYKEYHYIGQVMAPINYGVFFKDELVASCSFKRPTRQSKHDWELVRMSSRPDFRVHGIWSKILKLFIIQHPSVSVVSFSDNRIFDGCVYEKIGFKLDGEIRPDYYWVKGNKRHHKSSLRKTKEEKLSGKTEVELRQSQGYTRIWDLGKKRWVLKTGGNRQSP